jgi:hypothetical protein
MNILTRVIAIAALTLGWASAAHGQPVISLLVGNFSNFNGVDRYAITNGAYQGVFAGPGNGPPSYTYLTYGPDSNLYVASNVAPNPILRFNGMTGNPLGTFIGLNGSNFTFGTAGDLFRIEQGDSAVVRYNGLTGELIGTFATGLAGALTLHFGPGGDLFVNSLNSIKRFHGLTGAPLGDFVAPGAGGLTGVTDFLFVPGGNLLVSGSSGGANDKILEYDPISGAFIGVFAEGNGLNLPKGMTLGPEGDLYVASGTNSILKFNAMTGSFLGPFVPTTAHGTASYLTFTPFPVPEPSSVIYGIFASVGVLGLWCRARQWRAVVETGNGVADAEFANATELRGKQTC